MKQQRNGYGKPIKASVVNGVDRNSIRRSEARIDQLIGRLEGIENGKASASADNAAYKIMLQIAAASSQIDAQTRKAIQRRR